MLTYSHCNVQFLSSVYVEIMFGFLNSNSHLDGTCRYVQVARSFDAYGASCTPAASNAGFRFLQPIHILKSRLLSWKSHLIRVLEDEVLAGRLLPAGVNDGVEDAPGVAHVQRHLLCQLQRLHRLHPQDLVFGGVLVVDARHVAAGGKVRTPCLICEDGQRGPLYIATCNTC